MHRKIKEKTMKTNDSFRLKVTGINKVEDLLSVYALVADQFDEIQRLSRKTENDDLGRDIAKLSEHLSWMSEFFREAS